MTKRSSNPAFPLVPGEAFVLTRDGVGIVAALCAPYDGRLTARTGSRDNAAACVGAPERPRDPSPADMRQLAAAHVQFLSALTALAERHELGTITRLDLQAALDDARAAAIEIGAALQTLAGGR